MKNEHYKDTLGFRGKDGSWFLLKCFKCEPVNGRENWAMAVAKGQCAWCGYKPEDNNDSN